jgi:hypothetical protein
MNFSQQIAKHLRDVHFGGNWTSVNLKDTLDGITVEQATKKNADLNSIAVLVFHMNYYVDVIIKVLQGQPVRAHDKFSFELPPLSSEEEWQSLVNKALTEAETLAGIIEQLPDSRLEDIFMDKKYGTYYRNFHGLIEHCHYHLGQIMILKKLFFTT